MIKVIRKSFALMEFIALKDGKPVLPLEAARSLGLNQATTVRILKDLLDLGYLTQISRNKGYILGPMAHSVFSRNAFREKLIRVAEPIARQCAERIGESVILAVLQGARRYVLFHENRNPDMNIDIGALYFEDCYLTATGRMLLAHAGAQRVGEVVRKIGLPGKAAWPKASTLEKLNAQLAKIRRNGSIEFLGASGLYIMAFPVFEGNEFVAAFGASFPEKAYSREKRARTFAAVKAAAASISEKLTVFGSVG